MMLWVIVIAALIGRGLYEAINRRSSSALTGAADG